MKENTSSSSSESQSNGIPVEEPSVRRVVESKATAVAKTFLENPDFSNGFVAGYVLATAIFATGYYYEKHLNKEKERLAKKEKRKSDKASGN